MSISIRRQRVALGIAFPALATAVATLAILASPGAAASARPADNAGAAKQTSVTRAASLPAAPRHMTSAPKAGSLAAANAALSWPEPPHLVLWHAQTVLREHRGDGHVAALLTAGLDPVEALVLFAADHGPVVPELRRKRGWTPEEWDAGVGRLAERGLLAGDGSLTPAGQTLRADVEARTDALALPAWERLGEQDCKRLRALVRPLSTAVVEAGGIGIK